MIVDRHAHRAHFPRGLQFLKRPAPFVAMKPFRIPHVQLLEVEGVDFQIAQAVFRATQDVLIRKHTFDTDTRLGGPQAILGRYLGSKMNSMVALPNHFPHQLLAMAIAISQSGVDKVDAQLHGLVQRAHRFVIGAAQPLVPTNPPSAISKLTDLYAGSPKNSLFHPEPMIVK